MDSWDGFLVVHVMNLEGFFAGVIHLDREPAELPAAGVFFSRIQNESGDIDRQTLNATRYNWKRLKDSMICYYI